MQTKKHKSVISQVAFGWDDIEAPIIAFVSAQLPFIFQGVHGNAKTTVGELFGYVYGDDTFRYFDCSKANLLSMAGFPDAKAMQAGEQAFIPNATSLIGSDKYKVRVILLDEISRTPKDAQNLLLEVVERKSIFGIKTGHEVLIATMNPETYSGALKLDTALHDRFVGCIPVPDYKDISAEDIEAMIQINMDRELDPKYFERVGLEMKAAVDKVSKRYHLLRQDKDVAERIKGYVAQLISMCKDTWGDKQGDVSPYVSGRGMGAQLWRAIMSLTAYYMEIKNHDIREAAVEAAQVAIKYCIIVKHGASDTDARVVQTAHQAVRFILMATAKGPAGKLQIAFAKAQHPDSKISFWEQYADEVVKLCDTADQTDMINQTITAINEWAPKTTEMKRDYERIKLQHRAKLYGITKKHNEFSSTASSLEGALVCQLIAGMNEKGYALSDDEFVDLKKTTIKSDDIVDCLVHMNGGASTTL